MSLPPTTKHVSPQDEVTYYVPDENADLLDGKVHDIVTQAGPHSIVGERNAATGAAITYSRYKNGDISILGSDGEGHAIIGYAPADSKPCIIANANMPDGGVSNTDEEVHHRQLITDIVDGAFPKGATQIVPLAQRKSGDMQALLKVDVDQVTASAEGNGYRVTMMDGVAIFEQLDAKGQMKEMLRSMNGVIRYQTADQKAPEAPFVTDDHNTVPLATGHDNVLLAGKVLHQGGTIDAQEAAEISAALQRAKAATSNEIARTGGANRP